MSMSKCEFSDTHCSVNLTLLKGVHGALHIVYFLHTSILGEGREEVGAADVHENLLSFGCFVKMGSAVSVLT
jgi:hypothetical protein